MKPHPDFMEKHEISSGVTAFVHPEGRSNCGLIHTTEGVVLVDTTARPKDIQAYLELVNITPDDVCQILLTHSHSDHTSGIPLFDCPVLAHKLTRAAHKKARYGESGETACPRRSLRTALVWRSAGWKLEMIHVGGHTPGSSVVWLPEDGVLFAGDLIFEGRYPFLATARVPELMDALRWLLGLEARIIVPGHGRLCNNDEIFRQIEYLDTTWKLTAEHIQQGHSLQQAVSDPKYPIYFERGYEKLHPWNIKVIYQQVSKKTG